MTTFRLLGTAIALAALLVSTSALAAEPHHFRLTEDEREDLYYQRSLPGRPQFVPYYSRNPSAYFAGLPAPQTIQISDEICDNVNDIDHLSFIRPPRSFAAVKAACSELKRAYSSSRTSDRNRYYRALYQAAGLLPAGQYQASTYRSIPSVQAQPSTIGTWGYASTNPWATPTAQVYRY